METDQEPGSQGDVCCVHLPILEKSEILHYHVGVFRNYLPDKHLKIVFTILLVKFYNLSQINSTSFNRSPPFNL